MSRFRRYIAGLDLRLLVPLALLLAAAPFVPEPHLIEKLKMAWGGTLTRPIDIFDLVMHSSGLILIALRLALGTTARRRGARADAK